MRICSVFLAFDLYEITEVATLCLIKPQDCAIEWLKLFTLPNDIDE